MQLECRFFGGKNSWRVCVTIYSRLVRVIFEISRQNPKISKISKLCLILIHKEVSKKLSKFLLCSKIQRFSIRSTAVTGRNSTQAYCSACHTFPMHDTCYFQNSDSQLSYICTAYTSLACVAFATILHFQTLAMCQGTTWLVVTRPAAGHSSSVLSQAFYQSNFVILAICLHTFVGYVL